MNAWMLVFMAGLLETGWAVGLKYTYGFTKLWPSLFTAAALAASMILLAIAVRELPIGLAYPIWVGMGALGTAVFGIAFLGESASPLRLLFLALLLVSIVGLKMTSKT